MEIKTLIETSVKSRSQLIKEIGCSQAHFSLIENGERRVGIALVQAFADALDVEPVEIRPDLASLFQIRVAS